MLIVSQNRSVVWDFGDSARLFITGGKPAIQIAVTGGSGGEVAKYRSREQYIDAMAAFAASYGANDRVFYFPEEAELQAAVQHRSGVSTRSNRHGGS